MKFLEEYIQTVDPQAYGDISMILSSPMVSHSIQRSIVQIIENGIMDQQNNIDPNLLFLTKCLKLSLNSAENVKNIPTKLEDFTNSLNLSFFDLCFNIMKSNDISQWVEQFIEVAKSDEISKKISLSILIRLVAKKEEKKFGFIWKEMMKFEEFEGIISQDESFVYTLSLFESNYSLYNVFINDLKRITKKEKKN